MAIDLDKIKAKLTNLSQSNNRKNYQWKPQPGKQQVLYRALQASTR